MTNNPHKHFCQYLRQVVAIILLLPLTTTLRSQHCGWDYTNIIVVEIKNSLGQKINNLKLTLVDSVGKPYVSDWNSLNGDLYYAKKQNDTLIFYQNLTNEIDSTQDPRHLFVAKDNYYLIVGHRSGTDKIKVEDFLGKYPPHFISLKNTSVISLCGDYESGSQRWESKIIKYKLYTKEWDNTQEYVALKESLLDSSKVIKHKGRKYYFLSGVRHGEMKAVKTEKHISTVLFTYDSLNMYSFRKKDITHCIFINNKGIIVVTGKRKSVFFYSKDGQKRRKPIQSSPNIGTWKYYDNEGKLILKQKYKLPKKRKNGLKTM
ncbi:MAG: hypothetical protein Q8M29_17885 [Bacteroidota bacterium]|nr:hypothetical protein [Bacteroidota bacterium]